MSSKMAWLNAISRALSYSPPPSPKSTQDAIAFAALKIHDAIVREDKEKLSRAESEAKKAYDISIVGEQNYYARIQAEIDNYQSKSVKIYEGGSLFWQEFRTNSEACSMANHRDCGLGPFECGRKHHSIYETKLRALEKEVW